MKKTALYDRLEALGGRFVEFGGFAMPVRFEDGILAEHRAVRIGAGLFDVSHMGEFVIEGGGALKDIERLFTNSFADMKDGRVRYSLMCGDDGGVLDDLLVYRENRDKYYIVVNASNIEKDADRIRSKLLYDSKFTDISQKISMLAIQGPSSEAVAAEVFVGLPKGFYTFNFLEFRGERVCVSRTGYTGEDGFEIYARNELIVDIFDALFDKGKKYGISLAGLGARDTLRLESAMPLYGHEMNETCLATELGLDAYIKLEKVFLGRDALIERKPEFRRVGLKIVDKGIARDACPVFSADLQIGAVTSGTMSPTLGYSIAMARVRRGIELGDLSVEVRSKRIKAEFTEMPFFKRVGRYC